VSACLTTACLVASSCAYDACNKQCAIAVARGQFEKVGGTAKIDEIEARHIRGKWSVRIWTLPRIAGGFVIVEVSDDGKVISFERGH
jgi:hypothetical protein